MQHATLRRPMRGFGWRAASLLALATGCAAAPPPAAPVPAPVTTEAPGPPPPPTPMPTPEAPTEPLAPATAPETPPQPRPESQPSNDGPSLGSQKPIEVITARDAAYLIDYSNSEHKQKSEARCDKESKDDAEKRAACLTKAREQFLADVLRFKKDASGQVSLLIYKRNGSQLAEISVGAVQLSDEGNGVVKLKFMGQKGARPLWRGRQEAVISVPNSYTIELDEPELGHLRYDAKVGLVSN